MTKVRKDIKEIDIKKLKDYEKNNKIHPEEQISLLVQMIDKFGFTTPLLVDKNNTIIAGHGRKIAGERLGMKKLPCLVVDDLSDDEIKTLRIADNRIAELAENQMFNIKEEYFDLLESGTGIEFLTGYTEEDFNFLTDEEQGEVEEDDFEPPEDIEEVKTDIKEGDIIQLGNHRLMCGDSTSKDDVDKLMNGNKINAVITDPPYGMDLDADYSKTGNDKIKQGRKHKNILNDNKDFNATFIFDFFPRCEDIFLFGADYFSDTIPNKNKGSWYVWDKRVEERYDSIIGSSFEMCWSLKKRKREIIRHEYVSWNNRMEDNLNNKKPHPTMKPVKVMSFLIEKTTGNILDLFGGSGSTLIACEQLNRVCYMMEFEPHYCEVICQRWEKLTEKQRVKLN